MKNLIDSSLFSRLVEKSRLCRELFIHIVKTVSHTFFDNIELSPASLKSKIENVLLDKFNEYFVTTATIPYSVGLVISGLLLIGYGYKCPSYIGYIILVILGIRWALGGILFLLIVFVAKKLYMNIGMSIYYEDYANKNMKK